MFTRNESERVTADAGLFTGGKSEADFDSHGVYLGAAAGRDYMVGSATRLTPSAGLSYSWLRQEAFSESGGRDFDLDVDEADADSLVAHVGLDAEHRFDTDWGQLGLQGLLRYHYDAFADRDEEHEITVSSPFFGEFTQVGQNRGPNGVTVGLGLSGHIGKTTSFGVGYARTWNTNGDEDAIGAHLLARW
jgi:outer membrane autotransporter protein